MIKRILVALLFFLTSLSAQVGKGNPAFSQTVMESDTFQWNDGVSATMKIIYANSGTNVELDIATNVFNIGVGALQQGGVQVVLESRTLTAGIGLTGLGDLSINRTPAFDFTDLGADPALGAGGASFSNEGASDAGLVFEGDTNDAFETRLRVTDPTVADRIATIPNADSAMGVALTCGGNDKFSAFSVSTGIFTCSTDIGSNPLSVGSPELLTLVTDAVTLTGALNTLTTHRIAGEGATDDILATCNCTAGSLHILRTDQATENITITCTSGPDFILDNVRDKFWAECDATNQLTEMSRATGGN